MASQEPELISFPDSLDRDLECRICFEIKQLRLLPCQHLVCLQCLEKLYEADRIVAQAASGDTQQTAQPTRSKYRCSTCDRPLTGKPEDFPISALAEHFRTVRDKLEQAAKKKDVCQTDGCRRENDLQCTQCERFLCYRCREEPCEGTDDEHVTKDIKELISDSKETYTTWQRGSECKLVCMKNEMKKAIADTKRLAAILHECEESVVCKTAREVTPQLVKCRDTMATVQPQIAKLESELSFMESLMSKATSEREQLQVVQELQEYGHTYQRTLTEMEPVLEGISCCDAKIGPHGHIMACLMGELRVLDSKTGSTISGISFKGYQIYSIQYYKNTVVLALAEEGGRSRQNHVVILGEDYQEQQRWPTIRGIDLVVIDDKVHVSAAEREEIAVYEWPTGRRLPAIIERNGSNTGMAYFHPSSIVVLDEEYDVVQKYKINKKKFSIAWTRKVNKPWATGTDENGLIWIRSNKNNSDCITIITRTGGVIQELKDDRITKLGTIHGVGVHDNYLWLGHSDGLTRFKIQPTQ